MASRKNMNPMPIVKAGWVYRDNLGKVTVMAVVDHYVMARRPHAVPFVLWSRNFVKQFDRVIEPVATCS